MPPAAAPAPVQQGAVRHLQGIAVPATSVRPEDFFKLTRRHTFLEKAINYAGQAQDVIELRKADVIAGVHIRFVGQVVITPGTGTVATTARWPYDFLRQVRFTANGASNVINVSGLKLKTRDMCKRAELNDRGVVQTVGGVQVNQATMALASESWGVGSSTTGLAAGTYNIDLEWFVPIAEDEKDLAGAIFAATSSTDLTLTLDYEIPANLFVTTGNGTAALTGQTMVTSVKYSIPQGSDGQIVVPDLSLFHSLIQSRTTAMANGDNEVRIVGQGAGKSLLRVYYQLWNGAGTASAPLKMATANYGKQSWRFGNNETPDEYFDGQVMRYVNERVFASDLGGVWGFGCHDFAADNAFRDLVDMGQAGELRLLINVQNSVALNNPGLEYVTETIFRAGQAA